MQNHNTYINDNKVQILSQQKLTQKKLILSENCREQYNIKPQFLNQSTGNNTNPQRIKIISETSLNDNSLQPQTSQQENCTQQPQQQQITIQQDSFQKNPSDQQKQVLALETRVIISAQLFQDDLNETMAFTQIFSCSNCLGSLSSINISLPCYHYYHQECFYEMINLFLNQQYSKVLQCKCNISIPYKTLLRLASKDSKLVEDLLIQQQAWIISSAPLSIQNQISGDKKNINNIKAFIREQIKNYKAGLIKK